MDDTETALYIRLKYNFRFTFEDNKHNLSWKGIPFEFFQLCGYAYKLGNGGQYFHQEFKDRYTEFPAVVYREMQLNLIAYERIFGTEV